MGEEMIRGDKVDVVDMTQFNHVDQPAEQFLQTHVPAQVFMGNLVILAERAFKGAAAEKDRP